MTHPTLRAAGAACLLGLVATSPIAAAEAGRDWVNPPPKTEPGAPAGEPRSDQAKAQPAKEEPRKAEQARAEPAKVEPARVEETRKETARAETPRTPRRAEARARPAPAVRTAAAKPAKAVRVASKPRVRPEPATTGSVRTAAQVVRPQAGRPAEASRGPLQLMRLTTYELPDGRRIQVLSSPTEQNVSELLASQR